MHSTASWLEPLEQLERRGARGAVPRRASRSAALVGGWSGSGPRPIPPGSTLKTPVTQASDLNLGPGERWVERRGALQAARHAWKAATGVPWSLGPWALGSPSPGRGGHQVATLQRTEQCCLTTSSSPPRPATTHWLLFGVSATQSSASLNFREGGSGLRRINVINPMINQNGAIRAERAEAD